MLLVVTGDCADDGCLCTIKVACKDEQEGSEDQVGFKITRGALSRLCMD